LVNLEAKISIQRSKISKKIHNNLACQTIVKMLGLIKVHLSCISWHDYLL